MGLTGTVTGVCTSDVRGIQKQERGSVELVENFGIADDAHAGDWHRQISLLSQDKVDEFNAKGADVLAGAFGENILVRGIDFKSLPVGTQFKCNDVILEMTQIGKECHTHCQIYHKMGTCIMPIEGVFAKVLHGGKISVGDTFEML